MNIGELIELLRASAGELDEHGLSGLNADVEIGWCDGENLVATDQIDASIMTHLQRGNAFTFLMIRGHPHLEPDGPLTMRAVAADADSQLAEWADESGHEST